MSLEPNNNINKKPSSKHNEGKYKVAWGLYRLRASFFALEVGEGIMIFSCACFHYSVTQSSGCTYYG